MQSTTEISRSGVSQQPWFRIFAQNAGSEPMVRCDDLRALSDALGGATCRGVVLYVAPATALAASLAQGASAAQALADWSVACEALISVQRTYRAKLAVIEQPATEENRQRAQAALDDRFAGLTLPDGALDQGAQTGSYQALATLALGQDARALDLVDRLQAASLGPYGDLPTAAPLIETLLDDQRALIGHKAAEVERASQTRSGKQMEAAMAQQISGLEQALKEMQAKVKRLRAAEKKPAAQPKAVAPSAAQIQKSKQMDAAMAQKIAGLEQALEEARSAVGKLEAAAKKPAAQPKAAAPSAAQIRKSKQMEAAMAQQICGLEQALKNAQSGRSMNMAERQQLDDTKRQLENTKRELGAVYASTSWRILEPVRVVVRRFRR